MKSVLRPTSIDDLPALAEFLSLAFDVGVDAPFLSPAVMAWKYWDRREDWDGPRSYVLERDGAILAHAGIWPMQFDSQSGPVRGIEMIDWASAKDSPGAGLALAQKLAAMFDFIYSVGGSEMTRKVLPAFGFVEFKREWKGVRPLRPLPQTFTHQTRGWKLAPRLVRNWLLSKSRSSNPIKNWKASPIQPAQISAKFRSSEMSHVIASPRPPAFFEYLLRCPAARVSLHGILDGNEMKGYFAISGVRAQARLMGVWLSEPDPAAYASAYYLALHTAALENDINEMVAIGTLGPSSDGAAQAGFRILSGPFVYLLNKNKNLLLSADFQFQFCDTDLAFLDSGKPSYWS